MRNHKPGCPRLKYWDEEERKKPCHCFDLPKTEMPRDDTIELINWLDNAPFLMGKLTEKDKAIREKIISLILAATK